MITNDDYNDDYSFITNFINPKILSSTKVLNNVLNEQNIITFSFKEILKNVIILHGISIVFMHLEYISIHKVLMFLKTEYRAFASSRDIIRTQHLLKYTLSLKVDFNF